MSAPVELREVRVCAVEDVPPLEGRPVRVGGRPLAVFHGEGGFHVLDGTCTHMGGPLADGLVADDTVACPLHDRRFALATGRAVGHGCGGVAAYPTRVVDGDVLVTLPVFTLEGEAVAGGGFASAEVEQAPA